MATQVQDTEDFTEGHRAGEGWKETQGLLPFLALPASLASFGGLPSIFRLLRLADQMFEKINRTLPAGSFRLLFPRHGPLRLSLLLSLSVSLQCDTLRHALRREPLQQERSGRAGNKGSGTLRRVECTRGALVEATGYPAQLIAPACTRVSICSCATRRLESEHRSSGRNLPTRIHGCHELPREYRTDRLSRLLGYGEVRLRRYTI